MLTKKESAQLSAKFTCTVCGEDFTLRELRDCSTGDEHKVTPKTYYADADSLLVLWKTDRTFPSSDGSGTTVRVPGKHAQFGRGTFKTADPEAQMFFDNYPGCISAQQWEEKHISAEERLRQQKDMLTRQSRLIQEQSEELARIKEATEKQAKQVASRV